jgi:gamma-glutamyltranspeptidase
MLEGHAALAGLGQLPLIPWPVPKISNAPSGIGGPGFAVVTTATGPCREIAPARERATNEISISSESQWRQTKSAELDSCRIIGPDLSRVPGVQSVGCFGTQVRHFFTEDSSNVFQ